MNSIRIIPVFITILSFLFLSGFTTLDAPASSDNMMLEDRSSHSFDQTVESFEQKVAEAGWSIITVHNMSATLNQHGHDVNEVKVFELCSARYSVEILKLDDERIISALMPCRVAIYKKSDGYTYISRMDNEAFARPFGGVIHEVMTQAAGDIEEIIAEVI
ncbi:MAG: DUF302 domain-containing protein [Balneolia bacterium]|nr:DUF302 domain-containing protein [Balneolia bacterium]